MVVASAVYFFYSTRKLDRFETSCHFSWWAGGGCCFFEVGREDVVGKPQFDEDSSSGSSSMPFDDSGKTKENLGKPI